MNRADFMEWATKGGKFSQKRKVPKSKPIENEEVSERKFLNQMIPGKIDSGHVPSVKEEHDTEPEKLITNTSNENVTEHTLNKMRQVHGIKTWGSDIPPLIENFDELHTKYNSNQILGKNLQSQGFTQPRPIQMQMWPLMLAGREVLGCAPTGSGKTAAFMVPVFHHLKRPLKTGIRCVIVAPTRELAKQLFQECRILSEGLDFNILLLSSLKKNSNKSANKFDILICTPQLLVHLIENKENPLSLSKVEWLLVDESDKLFEDGKHSFRQQLAAIYKACSYSKVLRGFFSATFTHDVEQWCKLNLNNPAMVLIGTRQAACKDVKQELVYCGNNDFGKNLALTNILNEGYEPPCLIFVDSKERAKDLFLNLFLDNKMVGDIHADRPKAQREALIKSFREGKIWILVCTELMARGIDFKGVNLVINYDMPMTTISYIHRIGRTGRAGRPGRAITFILNHDIPHVRGIAEIMKISGSDVPEHYLTNFDKKAKKVLENKYPDAKYYEMRKAKTKMKQRKRKMIQKSLQTISEDNGSSEPPVKKAKKSNTNETPERRGKLKKSNLQNTSKHVKNSDLKNVDSKSKSKKSKKMLEKTLNQS